MKSFIAFLKKEWMEQIRTGHVTILCILFILFGIMNPAMAKLTPWMMEVLADSLAESGMVVTEITVDALSSWTQFYKNISVALIVFLIICCGTITNECQKGTLIPILTKGLSRSKVLFAKLVSLVILWTGCYWMCYAITYGYNEYFWDNSIAQSLTIPSFGYYLFGLWLISLVMLFSSFVSANNGVILGVGGVWLGTYLFSLIPIIKPYTPNRLTESMSFLIGNYDFKNIIWSMVITLIMIVINIILSMILFNKRKI